MTTEEKDWVEFKMRMARSDARQVVKREAYRHLENVVLFLDRAEPNVQGALRSVHELLDYLATV